MGDFIKLGFTPQGLNTALLLLKDTRDRRAADLATVQELRFSMDVGENPSWNEISVRLVTEALFLLQERLESTLDTVQEGIAAIEHPEK